MMKILFFNYEYPPLGGGAGNATSYIMREFSQIPGLEVDLVTSSTDNSFHLERIGENIKIHKLPIGKNQKNMHFQSQKDLLVYSWKAFFYSKKIIKKNKYDLTHSFFTVPCGYLSLVLKRKYKIPYIISLRGADVPGFSERFSFIYFLLTPIIRKIWKNASMVIACSTGLKELAKKTNADQKIEVIPNGINIELFKPDASKKPADKFIITLGGTRLTGRKGIKYLIEAVSELQSQYPQIRLKIIGDGDEKENLERQCQELNISSKIQFLGKINNKELPPYYQEASLFVLPSLNEGMSNAMLEALASGLPIVATDTGGARELIKDGINGYIIKFKNSTDIAEKVEKFLKDNQLGINMGNESRKIAGSMSWKNVAEKYYGIYGKISNK